MPLSNAETKRSRSTPANRSVGLLPVSLSDIVILISKQREHGDHGISTWDILTDEGITKILDAMTLEAVSMDPPCTARLASARPMAEHRDTPARSTPDLGSRPPTPVPSQQVM